MSFLIRSCLFCFAVFPYPVTGSSQEYHIDLTGENQVRFVSDAPLEDFQGVTTRIDGFVFLAGEGLAGVTDLSLSEFHFEVDLASLDTGLGLRNRHMRENYLETGRFPFASFSGRILELREREGRVFLVKAGGDLNIHGVARTREIDCRISVGERAHPADGQGGLRVECAFQVALSDHDIPIPKLMFMKINDIVELDLGFSLVPVGKRGAEE